MTDNHHLLRHVHKNVRQNIKYNFYTFGTIFVCFVQNVVFASELAYVHDPSGLIRHVSACVQQQWKMSSGDPMFLCSRKVYDRVRVCLHVNLWIFVWILSVYVSIYLGIYLYVGTRVHELRQVKWRDWRYIHQKCQSHILLVVRLPNVIH